MFATCLQEQGEGAKELRRSGSARMRVIPLDVASDDSVEACLQTVKQTVGETGSCRLCTYSRGVNLYGLRVSLTDFCDLDGLTGVRCNHYGYL